MNEVLDALVSNGKKVVKPVPVVSPRVTEVLKSNIGYNQDPYHKHGDYEFDPVSMTPKMRPHDRVEVESYTHHQDLTERLTVSYVFDPMQLKHMSNQYREDAVADIAKEIAYRVADTMLKKIMNH